MKRIYFSESWNSEKSLKDEILSYEERTQNLDFPVSNTFFWKLESGKILEGWNLVCQE